MMHQASIADICTGSIERASSYIVVSMCRYPRGIKKTLMDEYNSRLAPSKELLADWHAAKQEVGHHEAFTKSNYEDRFEISARAEEELKALAARSEKCDVFLVCQCEVGERCHREILLLAAQKKFGAKIGKIFHAYPRFFRRWGH
ncbi:MAG: DUF488 family protein [Bacteriovoracia bacterium]